MSNSSAAFSFPPPPPPPPKPIVNDTNTGDQRTFGPSRGRGHSFGDYRGSSGSGRGRGFGGSRGRSAYPSSRPTSYSSSSNHNQHQQYRSNDSHDQSQKRSFGTAFGHKSQSRPQAPPPVPSFTAGLEHLLSTKPIPPPSARNDPQLPRKPNLLGLTPAHGEASDSEDDGDEESKLAAAAAGNDIQFEYKGNVSKLRTPAEIAAWIAERRKRYPTQAKREAAQKEAEEKRKRIDDERKARAEHLRKVKEERAEKRGPRQSDRPRAGADKATLSDNTASDPKLKAKLRAEKLQRRLEKAQRQLAAAEAATLAESKAHNTIAETTSETMNENDSSGSTSDSSDLSNADSTSSAGSDSDKDSAPEELSSKTQQPYQPSADKVCTFFAKSGQCKFGKRCRYAHVRPESANRNQKPTQAKSRAARKGLWQVMVEKEEEEEQKKVLRAIIALGEAGMLDEPRI